MWSFFSRDPTAQFNYEVGDEVSTSRGRSVWELHVGKNKTTGDAVSIFVVDLKTADETQVNLARKSIKRFKTLRHPNIVTYIDELETEKVLYLVTEKITPLEKYLNDDLPLLDKVQSEYGISWGVHQIASGVGFLNDANLIHNNVCLFSIFVNVSGEWKLGGLEFMFANSESPVRTLPQLQVYEPPEIARGGTLALKQPTAIDLWGFGCLLWEVFNGPLPKSTQLKVPGKIPKSLTANYCEFVSGNPKSRPAPSKFLTDCKTSGSYFDNEFVRTMIFMGEIDIKDQQEKLKFFDKLSKILDTFPPPMCQYTILPKLLKAYEFGGAGSGILSPILKLGKYLDDAEYQQKIVPCVVKLFSSPDRATRVKLLQQLEVFCAHLKPKTVNDQIFPSLVQGFLDTNPLVRESTIKAMIHLAPKLGYKPLNEEVMKHFARLQSKDPEGGIRTNTTICLGKIACYLNPQIRQKILVSAFTRGVRDSYRPARLAAIQAMAATQKFYTVKDIATRLMPTLVALTVDDDPSVREAVFKVIKCFLAKLEKASENPDLIEDMEKDVLSSDAGAYDDSWAGWAMSLTSKFYKNEKKKKSSVSDSNAPSKPDRNKARPSKELSVNSAADSTRSTSEPVTSVDKVRDSGWDHVWDDDDSETKENVQDDANTECGSEASSDKDGWGDMDDWGDMNESEETVDDFKPTDANLASSSSYSGWENSGDDFLGTGASSSSAADNDFFSTLIDNKPRRSPVQTPSDRRSNLKKDTKTDFGLASESVKNADDDWSTDSWGSFDEPKKEKRLPKSKPMKLGARKLAQD